MMKRKQHVSGDNVTNKRSSTSGGEIDYFGLISDDLVINILSRLPVKSLAQCRSVSKLWSSIITRPNYNHLFPIKSRVKPRLLFIEKYTGYTGYFSSSTHEPQDLDKWSSLQATRHKNSATCFSQICPPLHGLICLKRTVNNYTVAVISNPSTGEYVTTPKVTTYVIDSEKTIYFGYDPIEKQFKVLCMTSHEYQVLTLGTRNLSWRKIHCRKSHYPHEDNGICINGVLYYQAKIDDRKRIIVCFDVRSEKFRFVNTDQYFERKNGLPKTLIDYKGKLGVVHCDIDSSFLTLLVLKDAKKHKWSGHFYLMPRIDYPCLNSAYPVYSAGMIGSGQIVLYQKSARYNQFYIFGFNLKRKSLTRVSVEVPGLELVKFGTVHIFSNFVEDLKLM